MSALFFFCLVLLKAGSEKKKGEGVGLTLLPVPRIFQPGKAHSQVKKSFMLGSPLCRVSTVFRCFFLFSSSLHANCILREITNSRQC